LWDLDVNSDIWNDIGLTEGEDGELPLWLADDDMRRAIKNRIESRRCIEGDRLRKEVCNLQTWCQEEWACYIVANEGMWTSKSQQVMLAYRQNYFLRER